MPFNSPALCLARAGAHLHVDDLVKEPFGILGCDPTKPVPITGRDSAIHQDIPRKLHILRALAHTIVSFQIQSMKGWKGKVVMGLKSLRASSAL